MLLEIGNMISEEKNILGTVSIDELSEGHISGGLE